MSFDYFTSFAKIIPKIMRSYYTLSIFAKFNKNFNILRNELRNYLQPLRSRK